MGKRGTKAHTCSCPGCENPVTHDLILYHRVGANRIIKSDNTNYRIYKSHTRETSRHVYLCDEHVSAINVFLDAYERR